MSLLNPQNPIATFIQAGQNYMASPGPGTGIELDDATIALKRHSLVQLNDHELAAMLEKIGKLTRNQMTEQVSRLFEETAVYLQRYQ